MDYELLQGLTPHIIDVVEREAGFWERFRNVLLREKTHLNVLAFVTSGEGELTLNGRREALSAGTVFQIAPDSYMRIETGALSPLCFYSFHFRYGLVRWDGGALSVQPGEQPLPFPAGRCGFDPALAEPFRQAFQIWSDKRTGYEWHVQCQFFAIVQRLAAMEPEREAGASPAAAAVQAAIAYMNAHYAEDVPRDALAALVSLSPGYFTVAFKKHTGFSPIQYLNKIRLDRAKALLKSTHLPIREIAEQVGFPDSFYFTRLFSKATGLSPRDYRNG